MFKLREETAEDLRNYYKREKERGCKLSYPKWLENLYLKDMEKSYEEYFKLQSECCTLSNKITALKEQFGYEHDCEYEEDY